MPIQDIIAIIIIGGIFVLSLKHIFSMKNTCSTCSSCNKNCVNLDKKE